MKNPKVCLIDDNLINRILFEKHINLHNVGIDVYSKSEELLEKIPKNNYAIYFIDFQMPGPGGVELANILRSKVIQDTLILYSVLLERDYIKFEHVFDGRLPKPFSPNELEEILKKHKLIS